MKILLVSPSADEFINQSKSKQTVCVALPLLAAYTPAEHEVIIADENYGDNAYIDGVDLVGISAMTPQAHSAYKIAKHYRDKGIKVVMGGIHASMVPDEALEHVDAICIGEGDALWVQIINDARDNKLQRIYKPDALFDMAKIPPLRHDLIKHERTTFNHSIIQATRGCPYNCDFCITSKLFGKKYRFRPVENVVEEIKLTGRKFIVFIDDNIFGDLAYSEKLFNALIPLKIKWASQSSLNMTTKNEELLNLARKSGCVGLFIGLESVSNLAKEKHGVSIKLGTSSLADISKKIKLILSKGIIIQSSIVFGLDNDDFSTFEKTVDFLKTNHVSLSSFCILTPYPGTTIHERLKKEGRILHEDWSKYNNQNVAFSPIGLTPQQLKEGSDWAGTNLYSRRSLLKRFASNWKAPIYYLLMNLFTRTANLKGHGPGKIVYMNKKEKQAWLDLCRSSIINP